MKKILITFMAILVVLSACSKQEDVSTNTVDAQCIATTKEVVSYDTTFKTTALKTNMMDENELLISASIYAVDVINAKHIVNGIIDKIHYTKVGIACLIRYGKGGQKPYGMIVLFPYEYMWKNFRPTLGESLTMFLPPNEVSFTDTKQEDLPNLIGYPCVVLLYDKGDITEINSKNLTQAPAIVGLALTQGFLETCFVGDVFAQLVRENS